MMTGDETSNTELGSTSGKKMWSVNINSADLTPTGNENPLLEMEFEKARVFWTLIWPNSFGILICCMIAVKWAQGDSGLMFWFMELIGIIGVVVGVWTTIVLLQQDRICLFNDKIILSYKSKFMKNKHVQLKKAKYSAMSSPLLVRIVIADDSGAIQFDPTLMSTKNSSRFYEILSQLSGRDITKLKNAFNLSLYAKERE